MNAEKNIKYVPEYGNDALSEVLYLLDLDVNIYHNAKVCGNWRINEHTIGATCFHIVTHGHCFLDVPNLYEGTLECGDLLIFPRELNHSMRPIEALVGEQQHVSFKDGETLPGTGILCGEVRFQHEGCRYLLDALPPLFIIKYEMASAWLQPLLKMIIDGNNEIGMASQVVMDKLTELLFIYALKQYMQDTPDKVGILSIYAHPRIARAVSAIHKHPEQAWTLETMAQEAMLSRSTFAETFKLLSGWTAGQYLTWWRMQLAWSLLKQGGKIAEVSEKVGYHSESSFARAFKKVFNISAGKVKRVSRNYL